MPLGARDILDLGQERLVGGFPPAEREEADAPAGVVELGTHQSMQPVRIDGVRPAEIETLPSSLVRRR